MQNAKHCCEDRRRHRINVRKAYQVRAFARLMRTLKTRPKPGVRPLSTHYPTHPIRVFGRQSPEYANRDNAVWE